MLSDGSSFACKTGLLVIIFPARALALLLVLLLFDTLTMVAVLLVAAVERPVTIVALAFDIRLVFRGRVHLQE